jgi:hypothetical protein
VLGDLQLLQLGPDGCRGAIARQDELEAAADAALDLRELAPELASSFCGSL